MFGKVLKWLDKVLSFFEEWTLFITVMIALISLFINVVLRYGFNYTLAWSEELVREVIIYTTFIGCSAAIKERKMIKIDASVPHAQVEGTLEFFQQYRDPDICRHDDVLWLAHGGHAVPYVSKDHYHADSPGIFVCDPAANGGYDVHPHHPGHP